jgi:alanyl-tRNA synthetase
VRTPQIRRLFLDYFSARRHHQVPSSSLVPDDPTLLLTTAGMVQFKPYFLGEASPPASRLVSLQKCVRTVDIDNIGTTDRHSTLFEMLGNFSFGDYGKATAVPWAYEFLTGVLGLPPERLWATVYRDDDETVELWRSAGIPAERIQRLGMADNYWDTGGPGPCGPCSEIFYDRGPAYGREGGPAVDVDRYLEVWNLVFMRHIRGEGGDADNIPIVGDLPRPCIESGLGLERAALVLQGVDTIHDIDVMMPVTARLRELTGTEDGSGERRRSERIVVDHVRASAFLVADGVLPSNEGRGYVLRRLLRRAIRHGRALGVDRPLLADLAGTVVDHLGQDWPELTERRGLVEQAIAHEEDGFGRTLAQGARLLDSAISRTRSRVVGPDATPAVLSGQTAFELHDTFGFPVDLTTEIAAEAGLVVDTDRFEALMADQRRRAQRARGLRLQGGDALGQAYRTILDRTTATSFVGHDRLTEEGAVVGLLRDGAEVPEAVEGEHVDVVLDRTPFYAESGGQVGDAGVIRTPDGAELRVLDTGLCAGGGLHVHRAEVVRGELRVGQVVHAVVDDDRRAATARSHSATHVLHAVLRATLGDHARQHGSLVAPGRLRFDVTHFAPIEPDALARIQDDVNQRLLTDPEVRIWQASRAEAQEAGAIALFGETYGDVVRVVDIGDFSRELCGGTHVGHGSQAGPVRLVGETSVGSGVRRIEALTGLDALRYSDHERMLLDQIASLLGVPRSDEILHRLQGRLDALVDAERELAELRRRDRAKVAERLARKGRETDGRWIVAARLDAWDDQDDVGGPHGRDVKGGEELRELVDGILDRCPPGRPAGVVLGMVREGKAQLVLGINPALDQLTVPAREILRPAGRTIGGGGGGVGRIAHAGGRGTDRLDEALATAAHRLATLRQE